MADELEERARLRVSVEGCGLGSAGETRVRAGDASRLAVRTEEEAMVASGASSVRAAAGHAQV